ncbi:hypothetical protein SNE40_021493 [Patella caerulea]|uniref:2'-5'-oligoadenylate synthetase 1 domain-containing protein n=1 Tax=Patella caerulea TaxID=87958 RepID=A0AAN8G809_PATCE
MDDCLPGYNSNERLEAFIDRVVRPPSDFIPRMKKAVNLLVLHLHNYNSWRCRCPYHSVQKVVKSGSLGKGTSIQTNADADLVVFFNYFKTIESLIEAKPLLLESIKKYMMSIDKRPSWMRSITLKRTTDFHVEFKIDIIDLGSVDVDLVPAMDVISQHDDIYSLYAEMMAKGDPDIRAHYSACLCERQIQLIRPDRPKVKDLIRLLKYWYKSNKLDMKSYFCEVIGLHVHRKYLNNLDNFNMKKGFVKALELLADFENLNIIPDGFRKWCEYDDMSICYVVDPANPFSNTVPWKAQMKIEERARETQLGIAQLASRTCDNVATVCPESAIYSFLQNNSVDHTTYENNRFSFCKLLIPVIICLIAAFALLLKN